MKAKAAQSSSQWTKSLSNETFGRVFFPVPFSLHIRVHVQSYTWWNCKHAIVLRFCWNRILSSQPHTAMTVGYHSWSLTNILKSFFSRHLVPFGRWPQERNTMACLHFDHAGRCAPYGELNWKYGQIGLFCSLCAAELSCFIIRMTVLGFSQLAICLSENCSRTQPLACLPLKWMGLCVLRLARELTSAVHVLDHGNRVSSYKLYCV